ncbi:MAG: hypothetical protein OXH27_06185 [Gammaproteobacteria bacterium]|nr:hypothetical protein [Gammaproteobacteria bacterium]MDE0479848.1 hypothetical protein [Gammaproteobacteria bacterium]MYC61070.1 hypothetical protein [Gammaproteobacteria bacterium]
MFNDLIEASGWSSEQFLAISIMAFVVLALMVVVFRMLRIFRIASRKPRYQPNLRPLRRRREIYREEEQDEAAEEEK